MSKLAVVQTSPIFLERKKTIGEAVSLITDAAANGAEPIIFTETFIPAYPVWIWRLRPGSDWGVNEELHARLLQNAVDLDNEQLNPLFAAAKEYSVTIVCGMVERDSGLSRATLYNTAVVIDADGALLNRHRKLMPTNPERMVWGFGDASGLRVVDTPCGRFGTLLCWENYMPLARYALYVQEVEIHIVPTYDSGDDWIGTLRHIAREGCCWVVGCGNIIRGSDIPDDLPDKENLYPDADEWINQGDSVVMPRAERLSPAPCITKKESSMQKWISSA